MTHQGRHWQLDGVTIRPRPLQQPRPPILVGSQVPAGIARAARIADGWLVVPVPTVDEFAAQAAAFAAARAAAGLPGEPARLPPLEVACAADEETAVRRAAPYLLAKYAAYLSWGIPGISLDPGAPPETQLRRLAANRFAVGSPAQVVEALLRPAPGRGHPRHHAGELARDAAGRRPGGPRALGRAVLPEVRRRAAAG